MGGIVHLDEGRSGGKPETIRHLNRLVLAGGHRGACEDFRDFGWVGQVGEMAATGQLGDQDIGEGGLEPGTIPGFDRSQARAPGHQSSAAISCRGELSSVRR